MVWPSLGQIQNSFKNMQNNANDVVTALTENGIARVDLIMSVTTDIIRFMLCQKGCTQREVSGEFHTQDPYMTKIDFYWSPIFYVVPFQVVIKIQLHP